MGLYLVGKVAGENDQRCRKPTAQNTVVLRARRISLGDQPLAVFAGDVRARFPATGIGRSRGISANAAAWPTECKGRQEAVDGVVEARPAARGRGEQMKLEAIESNTHVRSIEPDVHGPRRWCGIWVRRIVPTLMVVTILAGCEQYFRQQAECDQLVVAFCELRTHCHGVSQDDCEESLNARRSCGPDLVSDARSCIEQINLGLGADCPTLPPESAPDLSACPAALRAQEGEQCADDAECIVGLLCGDGLCVSPGPPCPLNASRASVDDECVCDAGFDGEDCASVCDEHSSYDVASDSCVCELGFVVDGQVCRDDAVAFCLLAAGIDEATWCAEGDPTEQCSGDCIPLPGDSGSCCCQLGFVPGSTDTCETCADHELVSDGACVCESNAVPSQSGTGCELCPANTAPNLSGAACVCLDDAVPSVGASGCTVCGQNMSPDQAGNVCVCDADAIPAPNGSTCVLCGANASPVGTDCACDSGFIEFTDACIEDPHCPVNAAWNGTSCACLAGYRLVDTACDRVPLVGEWTFDVTFVVDDDNNFATTGDRYDVHVQWTATVEEPSPEATAEQWSAALVSIRQLVVEGPGFSAPGTVFDGQDKCTGNEVLAGHLRLDEGAPSFASDVVDPFFVGQPAGLQLCARRAGFDGGHTNTLRFGGTLSVAPGLTSVAIDRGKFKIPFTTQFLDVGQVGDADSGHFFGDSVFSVSGTATRTAAAP